MSTCPLPKPQAPKRPRRQFHQSADGEPSAAPGRAAADRSAGRSPAASRQARAPGTARSGLADDPRAADDCFDVGEFGVVVMRARRIVDDKVEPAPIDRAHRAPLAPQLVAVEMFIVELEPRNPEKRPRLQAKRLEIGRAEPDPE